MSIGLFFSALFLAGGGVSGAQELPDGALGLEEPLIARIGEGGLGASELDYYLERYAQEKGTEASKLDAGTRREVLAAVLEDEMIFQEALKEGLHREEPLYGKIVKLYKAQVSGEGVRPEDFPEEELRRAYTASSDEFMKPAQYRYSLLIFPRGDESILELTEKARTAPAGSSGWLDGGWMEKEPGLPLPLPPKAAADIFNMKPGEIYGPVEDERGLRTFFRMTDYRPARRLTFEEVKPRVVQRLVEEKVKANQERLARRFSGGNETEGLFREALEEGYHRWPVHRTSLVDLYIQRSGVDRETLLETLREKYPVKILRF